MKFIVFIVCLFSILSVQAQSITELRKKKLVLLRNIEEANSLLIQYDSKKEKSLTQLNRITSYNVCYTKLLRF